MLPAERLRPRHEPTRNQGHIMPGSEPVSCLFIASDAARAAKSGSSRGSPTPRACGPSKPWSPPRPGAASSAAAAALHAEYARKVLPRCSSGGCGPPHGMLLLSLCLVVADRFGAQATSLMVPMYAAVPRHCSASNGRHSATAGHLHLAGCAQHCIRGCDSYLSLHQKVCYKRQAISLSIATCAGMEFDAYRSSSSVNHFPIARHPSA